jgi:GT2 family glycosyltransferase
VSDPPEFAGSKPGATVVVPTFRRPASLHRTLEALVAQRHPGVDWDVVVFDNDDAPGAAPVVDALAPRLPVPVRHIREPKRGACHARNRGISEVSAPITVFLDDDVVPDGDDWLAHLLRPLLEHRAQGVAGRVLLDPQAPRPDWFKNSWDGISFGQYDLGDEEQPVDKLDYINTANGAVETEWLRKVGGFDPTLGPREGVPLLNDDVRLCRRLFAAGAEILYIPDATAIHELPPARVTKRYIARREYFRGRSSWLLDRERHAAMRMVGLGAVPAQLARVLPNWRRQGVRLSTAYRVGGDLAYVAGYTREAVRCLVGGRRIPPDELAAKALPDPAVR